MNRRTFISGIAAGLGVAVAAPKIQAVEEAPHPELTDENVLKTIIDCGKVLDKQDVPTEDRWIYLPEWGVVHVENFRQELGQATQMVARIIKQRPFERIRRTRWAVIANTRDKIFSMRSMLHYCCERKDWQNGSLDKDHLIMTLDDGTRAEAEIFYYHGEDYPDFRHIRALNLTGAWVREDMPDEYVERLRYRRTGRYPERNKGGL